MGTAADNPDHESPTETDPVLESVETAIDAAGSERPVHTWNPPFLGDIDMRIAADGTWFYLGTPIRREKLVRLFSSILRREADDAYYLVTPVEKFGITVEDAPFLAIEMSVSGGGENQVLSFRTNVDDTVIADRDHPIRFVQDENSEGARPYVLVRDRLEALIARAVYYDLVELGTTRKKADCEEFGVWSGGEFFAMAKAGDLEL